MLVIMFFSAVPHGMWDLSSLIGVEPVSPALEGQSLNHWTPRVVPKQELVIILKSRDITLSTKARLVKAMVFPVVMYGCESWTIKKAERRRIDDFELWCWRRLWRVPWTGGRSYQSILKEISPGC